MRAADDWARLPELRASLADCSPAAGMVRSVLGWLHAAGVLAWADYELLSSAAERALESVDAK